jgi:hypothetical protein
MQLHFDIMHGKRVTMQILTPDDLHEPLEEYMSIIWHVADQLDEQITIVHNVNDILLDIMATVDSNGILPPEPKTKSKNIDLVCYEKVTPLCLDSYEMMRSEKNTQKKILSKTRSACWEQLKIVFKRNVKVTKQWNLCSTACDRAIDAFMKHAYTKNVVKNAVSNFYHANPEARTKNVNRALNLNFIAETVTEAHRFYFKYQKLIADDAAS